MAAHVRSLLIGVASGGTQGALGVGGGIIMIGSLVRGGFAQAQAVGTCLPTQILSNAVSGAAFAAAGLVDPVAVVCMGSASVVGAGVGAKLGTRLTDQAYKGAFGGFLCALAPLMAVSPYLRGELDGDKDGKEDPRAVTAAAAQLAVAGGAAATTSAAQSGGLPAAQPEAEAWTAAWQPERLYETACARQPGAVQQLLGVGTLVGLMSGAMGLGATPIMIAYMALAPLNKTEEYKTCIGTALCAVTATTAMGSAAHARIGSTQWRAVPLLAAGTVVGGLCGSSVAQDLPNVLLQQVFAVFCAVTGFKMLRQAWLVKKKVLK